MIKLQHVVLPSPEQMEFVIEGMRNPKNSWDRSDSGVINEIVNEKFIGPNDLTLMQKLSAAGTEHRKYMRMIPVMVRITAPLYWWKEFDTYKVGTVANSCSTMHKITEKEFDIYDFSMEHLNEISINLMDAIVEELNVLRTHYLEWDEHSEDLPYDSKKDIWWQMIQLLPSSYNQTRNVMLNYEVLANIYRQRRNHKLNEWRTFCSWIEVLPYSELITGIKEYDTAEYAKEHPEFTKKIREVMEERKGRCV